MAKKKDNETFDGQDISAIMNGDVFSSFLQVVNSTRNLLLTATPSPSYDTVSPENFATNDVEYVGFAKDGRNLVVTYYYDNDSLNTPSQSSVTIKDYFDNAEETMTVSKVKVSDFARKAFVNIADIAQSVSPEGDDWGDITQYLNGQEYSGQISYNETTGKLELTKFELSEGLVDNMTKSGEEYLAEGNNAIPLSLTPESYNSSVKINGTTYYFDTDDQRLQTLTRIGSSALTETGNEEDAVFSYGGKYYTYNPDKLPISACEYEEVTNETDILNGNYNTVSYKDGTIHYYDIVLNPSRMTSSSSVLWTETTKSEAIDDVTGKLKAGYLEIKMHKLNGTDDSRYMKYSLKSLSTPTPEDNQGVITSADKVTFPNTKLSDLVIGKPEGTNDLVMYYNGTEDRIKLTDWFTTAAADRIQKIVDSTGTEYDIVHDTAYNKTIKYLTEEDDEYTVSTGNIIVMALKGEDTLTVNSQNNIVFGGDGDDRINVPYKSNNTIYGGNGNDTIYTNDLNASIIIGGKGDDTVTKTGTVGGNNTFIFNSGDGNDILNIQNACTTAASNLIKFNDVKFIDLKFTDSGNDLVIHYTDNDSVTIKGWFENKVGLRLNKIKDITGNTYSLENDAPCGNIVIIGDNEDNNITVNHWNSTVYTFEGNDTISLNAEYCNIYTGDGNDTINSSYRKGNNRIDAGNGNDIISTSDLHDSIIIGGKGNDKITKAGYYGGNNTFIFNSGDGNDTLSIETYQYLTTNKIIFNDILFSDTTFSIDSMNKANLKIKYSDNDSLTLINWFNFGASTRIRNIIDLTGINLTLLGGSNTSKDDTFTANIADNRLVFDFFTTDNDTLTISDTNASGLHVAGNFKADGTLDGNGLRVLSDTNYTAWKSDTTSINGGVQIVSELGSVENITSADSKTVTASELAHLQSDVTAWLTAHTDYADVASAIANAGTDSSVSTLIAIFDDFNTTAWNS